MKEEVIKKIKFNSTSWCETNGSYYLVRINHIGHTVEFEWCGGEAPDWEAFKEFCLSDRDMVAELRWALTEYERLYPIFIKDRQGMSGCYDIELLISKCSHSWAKDYSRKERVLSLHISCADKMNEGIPDMFSGDLLEILHFMDNDVIYKIKSRKGRLYSYPKRGSKAIEEVASICGSMD